MSERTHVALGTRSQRATVRTSEVASRQEGVIARWQLLNCGITNARIGRWTSASRLHVIHPGVYAYGRPGVSNRGRLIAALLYAGRGAGLSHLTGGWWTGLVREQPGRIDLCSPVRRRPHSDVIVHRSSLERRFHCGLPVVCFPSLLIQIAASAPFSVTRKALAEADFRGWLDIEAIHRGLGRGKDGSATLRKALRAHLPQLAHCENDFEAEFLFICERHGIETPAVNVRVDRYRPDMLWRGQRLIVELDGRDAHTRPAQVARDHARDMALRELGYTVVRYTWAQVRFETERLAADLQAQLVRAS